jgi:DUF4097 and DUF4098 domain-containing protein YvlB
MSWLYSIVFAGLLFSGGDGSVPPNQIDKGHQVSASAAVTKDETETFEQSYPLNPNGRVSVSNVNGSIIVEAWDRNEVKLTATKIADSRETLNDVQIDVNARPDYFRVEVDYPEMKWSNRGDQDRHRRIEVQFRLSVPRTALLNEVETVNGSVTVSNFVNFTKISAVNGNVNAGNLRGTANLSTVNGRVIADFDRLETTSKINLSTVNGEVSLTIPSDANATIKADSLNGPISNEFGLPVRKGEYVGRDLYGRVGSDSGDWDDTNGGIVDSAKLNRDVARAIRDANVEAAKASREAAKETIKATEKLKELKDLKVKVDKIDVNVDMKDLEKQINEGLKAQTRALASMRDAMWLGGGPSIERKSNTFTVKGSPKVVIDAKNSNVRVRGWDRPEVKYVLTEISDRRDDSVADVKEEQTSSGVTLRVLANDDHGVLSDDGRGTRIEVFVPRKSDLKIISDGEIRLEGVSGEIDLVGADGAIDVRESDGKLNVTNADGIVRVVGFKGDLVAKTTDGEVYLDGDFNHIKADAVDGKFVLTLPVDADAEVKAPADQVDATDLPGISKPSDNVWKFGKGSRKYIFNSTDGSLVLQSRNQIAGL